MDDTALRYPLITAKDLRRSVDDNDTRVVDVRSTCEYLAGHLPGALHLDILHINAYDTRGDRFDSFMATVAGLLSGRGVDLARDLVFYEDGSGHRSARAWWFCRYLGAERVRVLDGGLNAWRSCGNPVDTVCVSAKPVAGEIRPRKELFVGVEELEASLGEPETVILDVRGRDEYLGRDVRSARGGAIPGAVNIDYMRALAPDGAYLPPDELKKFYAGAGVPPDRTVIVYCQMGYRSSHTFLALESAGYPNVRNYIGSWKEWGDRTDLPIMVPEEE